MTRSTRSSQRRNRHLYSHDDLVETEVLLPVAQSHKRKGSIMSCTLALVSTICGGGVLSLPYAFSQLGIIASLLVLVTCALASDFSVYLLVASARRSGRDSYEGVTYAALGRGGEAFALVLIFLTTFLCVVAYLGE